MKKKTLNAIAWTISACVSAGILYDTYRELKKKRRKEKL